MSGDDLKIDRGSNARQIQDDSCISHVKQPFNFC
jgi:hypothetical protein